MAKYPLSERQTDAILELRLYQLTGLERGKIEAEYLELMKLIEELRGILESEAKLLALIKKRAPGDEGEVHLAPPDRDHRRRRRVPDGGRHPQRGLRHHRLPPRLHQAHPRLRLPLAEARRQGHHRRPRPTTRISSSTSSPRARTTIILFSHQHRPVPRQEGLRRPGGHPRLEGQVGLELPAPGRRREDRRHALREGLRGHAPHRHGDHAAGITKKTNLSDYTNATREGGLRGIKLEPGDALVGCVLTTGDNEIVLVSHKGQAVRFNEDGAPRPRPRHRRRHRHALQV